MSAPKNIQRDCIFVQPLTSALLSLSSTGVAVGAAAFNMNSSGSENVDKATAQIDSTSTYSITADTAKSIGVLMMPPEGDRVPYRIKASISCGVPDLLAYIGIGYAPASPTGSGDSIDEPIWLPFDTMFDDTVIVEALDSGDGNYGRALAIALIAGADATGISAESIVGHLSVQNLGVKPPTMQNAVS